MPIFATAMLVVLTLIWGLTFPATKAALATTTPLQFLALRFLLGSTIFLIWLTWKYRTKTRSFGLSIKRLWLPGVGIGLLLMTGYVLQAVGMKFTTASRSGFFTGLLTIIVPVLALLFHTSRVSMAVWIAIPLAVTGIYFLAGPDSGGLNVGDILTIGCAAVFALQMVALEAFFNRNRKGSHSDSDDTTDALSLFQMVVSGIGCLILAFIESKPFAIAPAGWWGVIYTGIFGSVIAVWLQTKYQPVVPAGYAGMVFTLEPLWAALFAWLLLGDSWTTRGIIGAGFILSGMAISSLGMRGGR